MTEFKEEPRLPREWLPEATAPESAPQWEASVHRIMARAEPSFRHHAGLRLDVDMNWPTALASWWKPAAALAAAAAALLLLLDPAQSRRIPPGSDVLGVVAAEGAPAALLESLGIEVDPVLALITVQEQTR